MKRHQPPWASIAWAIKAAAFLVIAPIAYAVCLAFRIEPDDGSGR